MIGSGSGWQLQQAYGINNSGQIVGSALSKLVEDAADVDAAVVAVRELSTSLKQATRRGSAA